MAPGRVAAFTDKSLLWGRTALRLHVSVAGAVLTLRQGECCLPGWPWASSSSRAVVLGSPPLPPSHWAGHQAPGAGPPAEDVQGQVGGWESSHGKLEEGSSVCMALPPRNCLGLPSEGLHHVTPNLTAMGGQVLCPLAPPFPPHRGHGLSVWSGHELPGGKDHTSLRPPETIRAGMRTCDTLTVLWAQGHSTMSGWGGGV